MPSNRRRLILCAAAAVAACVWLFALLPSRSPLAVTFLDVGDGLCVVARTPSGKIVVVDCGTSSWRNSETIGEKLVAPYLQSMGADTIDVAVLTHPHADHVSGFAGLLAAKPARLVLDIGAKHASPYYEQFLREVESSGAAYRIASRGQSVDLGDGVVMEVLSPSADRRYSSLNDQSAIVRLTYGATAVLLAADAGEDAELDTLAAGAAVRSQVLQVGHHGGADSSSPRWVDSVSPDVAVISCALNSRHGHPSRDVVRRLELAGARVFVTGRDGAITVLADGETVQVRAVAR